jgi:ubiquinone/menaquinone biosynthesis C-methylase UbiE
MQKQVEASHYEFKNYISKERWSSFYHQIDEIIAINPASVLEVGVGSGLLGMMLKNVIRCNYQSIDVDEELKPDFTGSVLQMDFQDNSYDVVGCFQVLEHLSYEQCFHKALSEIFRVAKKAVIISLPDTGRVLRLHIPKICNQKIVKRPFVKKKEHKYDGQHYWEINKKNYEIDKIIEKINAVSRSYNFFMEKEFRVWENPYHHFFVLKCEGEIPRLDKTIQLKNQLSFESDS